MDPAILVSRFAAELGWRGLRRHEITLTAEIAFGEYPAGAVVTGFQTTDQKFFIVINKQGFGQFGKYVVDVVAERYDIRYHGFEACEFNSIASATLEMIRLS